MFRRYSKKENNPVQPETEEKEEEKEKKMVEEKPSLQELGQYIEKEEDNLLEKGGKRLDSLISALGIEGKKKWQKVFETLGLICLLSTGLAKEKAEAFEKGKREGVMEERVGKFKGYPIRLEIGYISKEWRDKLAERGIEYIYSPLDTKAFSLSSKELKEEAYWSKIDNIISDFNNPLRQEFLDQFFNPIFLGPKRDNYLFHGQKEPGGELWLDTGNGLVNAKEYGLQKYYSPETKKFIIPRENQKILNPILKLLAGDIYFKSWHHLEINPQDLSKIFVPQSFIDDVKKSRYFQNLSDQEISDATLIAKQILENVEPSHIEEDFTDRLKEEKKSLSERQKVLLLLGMGAIFSENYDESLPSTGEIPLKNFIAAGHHFVVEGEKAPTGVCRHINPTLAQIGEKLGLDTFSQDISMTEGGHAIAGFKSRTTGEIFFLNYGSLLASHTSNFEKALGVLERDAGVVTGERYIISDPKGEIVATLESKAAKEVHKAAGVWEPVEEVERGLRIGEIAMREKDLTFKIERDRQEFKLTNDHFIVAYTHLEAAEDPYQALAQLQALRFGERKRGKHYEFGEGISILDKKIKDLGKGVMSDPEILARAGVRTVHKKDFGDWSLGLSSALEAIASYNLKIEQDSGRWALDALARMRPEIRESHGVRLAYWNPKKPYKFFVEGKQEVEWLLFYPHRKIQGGRLSKLPRKKADEIKIGSTLNLLSGEVVNIGAGYKKADYATVKQLTAELKQKGVRVCGQYIETKFRLPISIPDKEELKMSLKKNDINLKGIKGALSIFGSFGEQEELGAKVTILLK